MSGSQSKNLLHTYLRRLTNLSGNNRSIFLPRLVGDQFIDIQSLSFLNKERAFSIIESLIANKQKVICPVLDARMEEANVASAKLKKLSRLDQFIFDERGSRDLHIGWPFVQGKFKDGTLVRCPLLFFPVQLTISGNQWMLEPREGGGITFNKSFLLAYSFYNKVKANEALLDETFEDADEDSTEFRTWLYHLLMKSEMEIHFNPDTYLDELSPFLNFKKEELEQVTKHGELKLFSHAVLGIFPQAGSYLVPDYMHLIEESHIEDLEEFFLQRTTSNDSSIQHFHTHVKEERMFTVFPQDIWQENAVKAVKLGHSLVVQGPPGTGKSQLICNLISDALASGKRVLVVCQKRAALDVVYTRMKMHQLNPYLALVHDFKNDRREIYDKLTSQIEKVEMYKQGNISLDAIQLERQFARVSHRMDAILEELETFKKNLYDETECGNSAHQLYLQSDPAAEYISLKQEFPFFRFDELPTFLHKLNTLLYHGVRFKQMDYAWRERKSFASFSVSDLNKICQVVNEVNTFFQYLTQDLQTKLNISLDWEQCEDLINKEQLANDIKDYLKSEDIYTYFKQMIPEQDEATSALWLSNIEKNLMSCFEGEGPEINTPSSQLGALQKALHRSMKARRSLFGLIRWELFSKDKFLIKRTLVANNLLSNKEGFKKLELKLDIRLNLEHNLTKLREQTWLCKVPETYTHKEFITWFADQHFALRAKLNFNQLRWLKARLHPAKNTHEEFISKLSQLYSLLNQIPEHKIAWSNYLTPLQVRSITSNPEQAALLTQILKSDFDALCEFDTLEEGLSKDEQNILNRLNEHTHSWDSKILVPLFLNSLRLAWIEHIEMKHPELRMVSSGKIALLENELRDLHREKQQIGEEIVLLRAREKVVDELKFNRLNNRVTYRDLLHQVTKKKKIWPIRKLVSEFEEEVFKLIPCWLASPESVSAIFPMKDLFDLVIFDEASQCFAERGIPSLYRGKQAVIAGDAMQLRPGDFYQSRWQNEDEEHPDAEVDSLLELAGRYLMNTQLRAHYRSKTPELIDFSNQHFYKGNLQFLPDLKALNQTESAMVYEKINGQWKENKNEEEAIHIVHLVTHLLQRDPAKEIGIVTFNAPQQTRILDLLEAEFSLRNQSIPENLFVKNIENVQGDERDVIIFSIGYAPDEKGKVQAQFGSLNTAGGENRLNVAVSRAREKIIVVTSLLPEQLHVEDTLNNGPKLLKKYLQFVLDTSQGKFQPATPVSTSKSHSVYLKTEIQNWLHSKWPDRKLEANRFPYFDYLVKKEERPVGALFTDDDLYFQSPAAKADHVLTPQLMELKNWPYMRAYSRNVWLDREKFFNEVSKLLAQD